MRSFGHTPEGREVYLFTLANADGPRLEISNFGGTIVRWWSRDRGGELADIVLGCDGLEGYENNRAYFGATVGRYANRIAGGQFELEGRKHQLAANNRPAGIPCHLHGGMRGFDRVCWEAELAERDAHPALRLEYRSRDGEEGYPGNLDTAVTYILAGDELRIEYMAVTDQSTPLNLTNHTYFNLAGEGLEPVLGHVLTLNASHYTPVDAGLIPTGEIARVTGTPFDFTSPHAIRERIESVNEQLRLAGGYDHNYVIDGANRELVPAATVFEPRSGRLLEVSTTEPGIQFYSGNFLDGTVAGKNGHRYPRRSGFCLETQHFPDSPNQPAFPSTILRPGETFRSTTVYRVRVH